MEASELRERFPQASHDDPRPALDRLREHLAENLSCNADHLPEAIGVAKAIVDSAVAQDRLKDTKVGDLLERLERAREEHDTLVTALHEIEWRFAQQTAHAERVDERKALRLIASVLKDAQRP